DHLLGEDAAGLLHLPGAGSGRDANGGGAHRVPLLEAQRPVVHAGREPEAIFRERRLAAEVAAVHAADLRDGDVALVHEYQRIVRDVFEQRRGRLAGLAAGEIARIVLDAGAGAGRLQHFEVEAGALLQPLSLGQPAGALKFVQAELQLLAYRLDGLRQRRLRRHVVRIGVDLHRLQVGGLLAGQRVEFGDRLDLVAEQRDAPGAVL